MQLLKWWSQYLESRGEFEKARKTYTRAQDYLSLVRLACHGGQVERVRSALWFSCWPYNCPLLLFAGVAKRLRVYKIQPRTGSTVVDPIISQADANACFVSAYVEIFRRSGS